MTADPARGSSSRSRALGLRGRLTLGTTAVVAVGLTIGAWVLVGVLDHQLVQQLDDSARHRAADIAALADSGRLPDPVPASSSTDVIQVVDSAGRVVAASAGSDRLVPILEAPDLAAARAGSAVDLDGRRLGLGDRLRVVAVEAGPASSRQTVLVAVPVTDLERSLSAVRRALLVAVPLLVLASAGLGWLLVGSALGPVDALRRGAESIGRSDGPELLPVPAADDELRRLAATLNAMLVRMRAGAERQRSFVSDAAHELRSPLASIRTGLEVSLAHPDAGAWERTAAGALADTERMSRLVDDLLLLARIDEAGASGLRAATAAPGAPTDVAAVVDEVLARLPPGTPVGREPVGAGVPGPGVQGPARVAAGRDTVTRIVANLVENARRHARTAVRVSVVADGAVVRLVVADDGPGIPEADRARVFERFTRLDDARGRDEGGSGLGLAIVGELTRACGGSVELADAGPGLLATVRLPAAG
jgi:signal transduction histidine kinase